MTAKVIQFSRKDRPAAKSSSWVSQTNVCQRCGHRLDGAMKIQCKLISPTNLQLRRPMLSPIDEEEFYIIGVKSFKKDVASILCLGIILGMVISVIIVSITGMAH